MRKNVLVLGMVFIAIGLIMWFIGQHYYAIAYQNYLMSGALSFFGYNPSSYENTMGFWSTFSAIGFILFIIGIPVTIAGAAMTEIHKDTAKRNCPNCGRPIPMDAMLCPYCNKKFVYEDNEEKQIIKKFLCPKCGIELTGTPKFCYKCGVKLK